MSNISKPTPQFGTAEYAGVPGTEHCQFCKQPIGRRYYRVNAAMAYFAAVLTFLGIVMWMLPGKGFASN